MQQIKVWDALVRWVHWGLGLSIVAAALTAGDPRQLTLHIVFGSLAMVLVVVRLVWGLVAPGHARFASFLRGPRTVIAYGRQMLRGRAPRLLGHNPPAGWVMLGMMLAVLAVAVSGLVALGGQEQIGALAAWIGVRTGHAAKDVHEVLAGTLWTLVGMHLAGVALHIVMHRENVVRAMFTGRKMATGHEEAPAGLAPAPAAVPRRRLALRLAVSILPALVLVPWLVTLPGDYRAPTTRAALAGTVTPVERAWRKECGACHFAFPPELMPERTWRHIFANLEHHYGQDAWLPQRTRDTLARYAITHSAEHVPTKAGFLLWHRAKPDTIPLRITASPYWKHLHGRIPAAVFRRPEIGDRTNCGACHRLAVAGSFEGADIHVPHARPEQRVAAAGAR